MMAITVIDVIGRYVFNSPLMGAYELVGYLMAIAGPWAIGYSQIQKGHIRVDFILKRFPKKGQAIITSMAYLIGVARLFRVVLAHDRYWRSIILASRTATPPIPWEFPSSPFVIIVAIGLGMLALVLLFDLIHTFAEVKKK